MKRIPLIFIFIFIISYPVSVFAQRGPDPKNLIDKLGRTAQAYFLTANRPTYDFSAFILDKGTFELSIDPDFNNNTVQVPLTFSYGLSKRVELFTGIDMYNEAYKFDGVKSSGIGDANIGFAWQFQHSKSFTHVFQTIIKIPTASASSQIGTGHPDYHFGIAQGFTYKKFVYELSFEFGFLHRRDLPSVNRPNKIYSQGLLDSIKTYYDYKFEPEVTLSFTPSINLSDNFLIYTGLSFSRNTKLDYNTSIGFLGFGFSPSNTVSLTLGASDGFDKGGNWQVNSGIAFTFY